MKRTLLLSIATCLFISGFASADTFGTGENQFEIEFVTISGDATIANGTNISKVSIGELGYKSFTDPGSYRIGKFEITNDQWNKFINDHGMPTGSPPDAYNQNSYWKRDGVSTNNVSWYEAAQFVNWLNTSTSFQAAYKFTGTKGQIDYTFSLWESGDNGYDPNNPYRNSNAFYFLPNENEWVKAAYWNGTTLQTYATIDNLVPVAGLDTNYNQSPTFTGPWNVGSGSEEVNGTFDMMGNVHEWTESPYDTGVFSVGSSRNHRGGSCYNEDFNLILTHRGSLPPYYENIGLGFRVASVVKTLNISIDVNPRKCPNEVSTKGNGAVQIAICGSDVLNVEDIDIASIEVLGCKPVRSKYGDVATPVSGSPLQEDCLCNSNGADGYLDLILKFDKQDIIGAIGEVQDGDYVILTLTGSLKDGTPIEGTDCVRIIKKGKH